VVRSVDGFVHIHFGVREFVLTAALAEELGIAVTGHAAFARRGYDC
jgi:hypothetical protein